MPRAPNYFCCIVYGAREESCFVFRSEGGMRSEKNAGYLAKQAFMKKMSCDEFLKPCRDAPFVPMWGGTVGNLKEAQHF